jgi:hypothetical protein
MRFSPSLKSKIAFIVLLLFLGGIWLLTFLTTARLQDDFAEVLANQQFSAVSHTAAEIEQKIQSRFDLLDVVAKEITPAMLADPARLRALLANRPVLLSLFNNGVVAIAKDGLGIADYPPLPERTGSSYTGIEYFNLVMATGKPAVMMVATDDRPTSASPSRSATKAGAPPACSPASRCSATRACSAPSSTPTSARPAGSPSATRGTA